MVEPILGRRSPDRGREDVGDGGDDDGGDDDGDSGGESDGGAVGGRAFSGSGVVVWLLGRNAGMG